MSTSPDLLRAGATVAHPSFTPAGLPQHAAVVEIWPDGSAELDNGLRLLTLTLVPVATGERWLPVAGYAGHYLVSSYGKLVSTRYRGSARTRLLRVLAPARYPAVALSNGAGVTQIGLNRLVAQHFLPPPDEARCTVVLPRDGNPLNLCVDNLQWVDPREVADPDVAPRLHSRGEHHANSRLTTAQVVEVRHLAAQGTTNQALANQFGVSRPTISQIVNGHARCHD